MKKFSSLRGGVASFALGAALLATPAFAQGQPTEETLDEDGSLSTADESGYILVTGSRIARPQVESEAPLQIVDDAAIDDAGVTNIQELLLENPVFGTPALSRTNSNFLTAGTGVATVDLRDLGSDRTLVLIDGRRVVSSLSGSATVDLNVIPTQFLERVDVLTGGASSLYGSDAVAGVVNFVYKDDFEGLEMEGQYGLTERGDSERYQLSATMGGNFADDRGNIMVHLGYSNEKGLAARERKETRFDDLSAVYFTGNDEDILGTEPVAPFYSSFPPQGRFLVGQRFNNAGDVIDSLYNFTYGPNGQLQPCSTTNGPTCDSARPAIVDDPTTPDIDESAAAVPGIGTGIGPNGFNRQQYRLLAVPVERYLFAAKGDYEITDNINAFFEGTYSKTSSSRIIEPFPLESGGANGIFPTDDGYNIENVVTRYDADGNITGTEVMSNPFVPAEILAAAVDTNGDGLRDIGFAKRLSDFGNRAGSTERDFYRFVVGFDGGLFDDQFRWDVSYNYGQVNENQKGSGQVNVVNFRDALAVQMDVDDLDRDGLTDDIVCISAEARANGCAAANIFGTGVMSQDAVNYIAAQTTYQTSIKQNVFQANLSGTLVELPAGPLGIAVGAEHRKEESSEDWDALTNAGLNAGNKLPDTNGSFNVTEFFGEVNVPILSGTPFFELLEVGGAFRYSDYSTVGGVSSYSARGNWQPVEDITIRGTWARAVRAPNVSELFSGLSQTFPSGLQDPCVGIGATGDGALGDNCRADAGVAANIAQNGEFTLNQSDLQGISGFNGGNPDLEEETADSWTVGATINPRSISALRNLVLTVDYYNIKIKDVIAAFPRQFSLDQCYGEGNDTFCDLIVRRQTATAVNSVGSIDLINALSVNAAILETDGLDVTLNWSQDLGLITEEDRLTFRGAYTHVFNNDYTPLAGADVDPSAGEIGTAKDRFTTTVAYMNDLMKVSFTGTYIGKSYEDDQFCSPSPAKCDGVPAEFYLDMQSSLYASDQFEIFFGIDNLLDNDAPIIPTQTTFNTTGSRTAADVYDIFGRRFYTGARLRF